jgi:hypothetical protein
LLLLFGGPLTHRDLGFRFGCDSLLALLISLSRSHPVPASTPCRLLALPQVLNRGECAALLHTLVRRPLRPFWRPILTEICLGNVCSCHEILRRNGGGQAGDRGGEAGGSAPRLSPSTVDGGAVDAAQRSSTSLALHDWRSVPALANLVRALIPGQRLPLRTRRPRRFTGAGEDNGIAKCRIEGDLSQLLL